MAIKVDLEKAYRQLSFIHDTLSEVGILISIICDITRCITSASINVLWEGAFTEDFKPTRGIRQRDHFSPYIFVFCIGRLSHRIKNALRAD